MSIIKELWMVCGEEKETASNRELEMLICGSRSGKNRTTLSHEILWWKWSMSRRTAQRRTRKICRTLRSLFVTEGNEKADELAKAGAILDEGFYGGSKGKKQCSKRGKRCTQHCIMRPAFYCLAEEWKDCEELMPKPEEKWIFVNEEDTKHRTEWCGEAEKYRCM